MGNFTINYSQTATVSAEYNVDLDPEDYIDYASKEEVESAIIEFLSEDTDYGDCDLEEITNEAVIIPEEFWEVWNKLKGND